MSELKQTITARFIGGTMHGRTEELMTSRHVPANVMVPQYGPPDDNSILHERQLLARETYERDRELDAGHGDRAVFTYRWTSYEPVHAQPKAKGRR